MRANMTPERPEWLRPCPCPRTNLHLCVHPHLQHVDLVVLRSQMRGKGSTVPRRQLQSRGQNARDCCEHVAFVYCGRCLATFLDRAGVGVLSRRQEHARADWGCAESAQRPVQ